MVFLLCRDIFTAVQKKKTNKNNAATTTTKTYQRVHIQNLFVPLVLEEKAVRVVIKHLEVGAGVGCGHLCLPVVVAEIKRGKNRDVKLLRKF